MSSMRTDEPGASETPAPRPLPRTVWALGLVSLLTDVGGDMVFPVLPRLLGAMPGVGAFAVGVVEGIGDAVSHLVKPFVGARSDRIRRRKPYVLFGYGLSGLARPVLAVVATLPAAVLVRSLDRVGKGIRSAPRDALIAASVPRAHLARAFSLHRAMDHAGAVLGGTLAAVLLWCGLEVRQVIALAAIPGALAFLTIVFLVHEPAPLAVPVPLPVPAPGRSSPPLEPRLRSFLWILFLFSLAASSDALLLLRAGEMGLSAAEVAAAWVVLHLVKVVASVPGGALADRAGAVPVIVAGWVVYAAVYAGFALGDGPVAAWALFVVYGTYYALTEGAEKAVVARLAPAEAKGRALGMMALATGAGTLVASLATAALYALAGPEIAFGTGALVAIGAAALLAIWARR